jgi:ribosome-associated protein
LELYGSFITDNGILRIDSQVHRTQEMNKEVIRKKFSQMIHNAFKPPKPPRKITLPPQHAIDSRIAEKKRRSKTRNNRTVIK